MKQVYRSSNEMEAQMICNLLEQAGIEGHISGEHLQGLGISNQPIQIFVVEEDFERAQRIIETGDPEAGKPEPSKREFGIRTAREIAADEENGTLSEPGKPGPPGADLNRGRFGSETMHVSTENHGTFSHEQARQTDWGGVLMGLFVGILIGIGAMFWAYSSPVEENGIDYDGDGRLEEQWTYVDDRISKSEMDLNQDGVFDSVTEYDHLGLIEYARDDLDFNGTFDTEYHYEDGQIILFSMDRDENGFFEYTEKYLDNGNREIIYWNQNTEKPFKIIRADPFGYVDAELDLDGDGRMDIYRKFDETDEIIEERKLN